MEPDRERRAYIRGIRRGWQLGYQAGRDDARAEAASGKVGKSGKNGAGADPDGYHRGS